MRHYVVFGFATTSKDEVGKPMHLGMDRGKAIAAVNEDTEGIVRKELFELANPNQRRYFTKPTEAAKSEPAAKKPAAKKTDKSDE